MSDSPTERQVQILRCMREVIAETGEAPPVAEIAERVGLSSKSAVHYQPGRLQQLGSVTRGPHRHKTYRLVR
ncbi:LexA family protein [Streptomyces sp. NPDC059002]|uniref:LexA family protein n=1 Tax=Streptomyces sp. NPDC059002 TaxID=3346690 RepID=UPI0036AB680C